MGGVEKSGLSEILFEKAVPLFGSSSWKGMLSVSAAILVLSNLVSNVPAVMLFAPHVKSFFPNPQNGWLVLAMASTLAGNFTLVGSVANLIVAEIAKEGGVTISFWKYLKVGALLTIITILIGAFWLLYV
jgi:Na+/H+ antiporter NhaD/arsenite permease-like protein